MPVLDFITGTLLPFLLVLGPVVVLHELGHFLAAKAVGIRVEQFSIGFPPRMIGKRIGDTDYCLSWIPLGGYVKMAGMIDESMESPEKITGAPDEFMSKKTWQKTLVITAGVLMNFLLAVAIFTGDALVSGVPIQQEHWTVQQVLEGSPAEAAGLHAGDQIVGIDALEAPDFEDFVAYVGSRPGVPMNLEVQRGAETLVIPVTPRAEKVQVGGRETEVGRIGVLRGDAGRRPVEGPAAAIAYGFQETWQTISDVASGLGQLVTGRASFRDLGGPILIAQVSAEAAKSGVRDFIVWIAFISINVGFLNILPVPALDGGHFVMVLWEAITRRPISTRAKLAIQQVGMVMLLALMVGIIWNDITRR